MGPSKKLEEKQRKRPLRCVKMLAPVRTHRESTSARHRAINMHIYLFQKNWPEIKPFQSQWLCLLFSNAIQIDLWTGIIHIIFWSLLKHKSEIYILTSSWDLRMKRSFDNYAIWDIWNIFGNGMQGAIIILAFWFIQASNYRNGFESSIRDLRMSVYSGNSHRSVRTNSSMRANWNANIDRYSSLIGAISIIWHDFDRFHQSRNWFRIELCNLLVQADVR